MVKKPYLRAEIEITRFGAEDAIVTSAVTPDPTKPPAPVYQPSPPPVYRPTPPPVYK